MLKNTKWSPSLKNKKVTCISNASGNGLVVGNTYYIKAPSHAAGVAGILTVSVSETPNGPTRGGWTYIDELAEAVLTPESLKEQIKNLQKEQKALDEQIKTKTDVLAFLQENNLKEADEDLIKTFRIMKKLNLGNLADAQEVVTILNS